MSIIEDVWNALDPEVAKSRQTIADELGVELQTVSVTLTSLKNKKRAQRTAGGWVRLGEATEVPAVASLGEELVAATPARRRKKKRKAARRAKTEKKPRKAKRAKRRSGTRRSRKTVEPTPVAGVLAYAINEAGHVSIERTDGNGGRAIIAPADALRLAEFIERCRPLLEAA